MVRLRWARESVDDEIGLGVPRRLHRVCGDVASLEGDVAQLRAALPESGEAPVAEPRHALERDRLELAAHRREGQGRRVASAGAALEVEETERARTVPRHGLNARVAQAHAGRDVELLEPGAAGYEAGDATW